MRSYFTFDFAIEAAPVDRRHFSFLFKSPGALSEGDLSDAIEQSVRGVLAPDIIAIVCMGDEPNILVNAFKESSELKQAANRTSGKISLCVCSMDNRGQIQFARSIRNARPEVRVLLHRNSDAITRAGLAKLFSMHHVLVSAPPGFTFVKPSGERATQFLRTEEALTEVENVQFLSSALLARISRRAEATGRPIEVIYIDTMAIASVAYALRDMYCSLFDVPRPRVVSFHSHDGLRDLEVPLPGTSFCIISASSSMRLERLWCSKTHCHQTEVVTLLTLENAESSSDALFALPNNLMHQHNQEGLKDIRMTGERFAPEELRPKKVLLNKGAHYVSAAADFAERFSGAQTLTIQGRGNNPTGKVRPLFLHGESLLGVDQFTSFLLKALQQKVPASTRAIVFQNDGASRALAVQCAQKLRAIMHSAEDLPMIPHTDLETSAAQIQADGALLIVAAVVGRGTKLLSISRDLRPIHTGARTYVIGAQVAETQAQIISLERNLKYSAGKAQIHVTAFASVAIGQSLSVAYHQEREVLTGLSLAQFGEQIARRFEIIAGSASGIVDDALLPTGTALQGTLCLRPDFAYWNYGYDETAHHTPAVLMTVAAVLQQARESTTLANINRLGTDAFQQVVLDPENFARYNDGIIQGAMLRAALPGELDYSSESEASRYMLDLIIKIISQHERPQGEAALEFALALKTGRLKLIAEHKASLLDIVRPSLQGNTGMKKFLRVLLEIEAAAEDSLLPDEF